MHLKCLMINVSFKFSPFTLCCIPRGKTHLAARMLALFRRKKKKTELHIRNFEYRIWDMYRLSLIQACSLAFKAVVHFMRIPLRMNG